MIPQYRVIAERLRAEMPTIERLTQRAEAAIKKARQNPQDQDFFLASAALDMHGFYAGIERLFEVIAVEVDQSRPAGQQWHRALLTQMSLKVAGLRPAVLVSETQSALVEYLEFRHVVRNVYTFNLRPDRVAELVRNLGPTFRLASRDLLAFADFLETLSTANE